MPISLDQAFSSTPTPAKPVAAPSGVSLDEIYKNQPKAKAQTRPHVGLEDLEKAGKAAYSFVTNPAANPLTRPWWNEFVKESNSAVAGLREDVKNINDVPTGDVVGGWKDIGKGLLDLVGTVATPVSSAVTVGVSHPLQKAAQPLYNLTKTDPGDQELLNNFIDQVSQVASGFVGGEGSLAREGSQARLTGPLSETDRALATSESRPKPRFKVVGTTESGKPILRQVLPGGDVSAPKPVPTKAAASKAALNIFDELAIKSKQAAQAFATQTMQTHPLLGEALIKRASEKSAASLSEQISTGVQSAREAATGWEPTSLQYLDALHARMLPDYTVHTANFERNGIEQSSHRLLDTLISRARSSAPEAVVNLLSKIREVIPDLPVRFKQMLQDETGIDQPRVAGWYIHGPKEEAVEVKLGQGSTKTLIHELVHAATVKFIEQNPFHPAVKELNRLFDIAHQRLAAMPREWQEEENFPYGLRNTKEFVAEALSNPSFQDWLVYSEGYRGGVEKLPNLWSRFVSGLHKVFGVKDPLEARLLHNVARLSNHIMDLQARGAAHLAVEGAGKAANEAYRLADRGDAFRSLSRFSEEKLGLGVVKGKIQEYVRFFQENFAPESMGIEARKAGATLAEAIAKRVQSDVQVFEQGKVRRDFWLKNPGLASRFISEFERGQELTDPVMKSAAEAYRAWAGAIADQDKALGIDYEPIDHYMPHIFQNSEGVEEWLNQRFGTSWTKPGFAKDRGFDLYEQAIKAGFKPKYDNPEDIFQARQQASNLARMKVEVLSELERQGLAVAKEKGDKVPEWLAASYPSPNGKKYWVDKRAAQLVHNALNSRSLWNTKGPVGDGFRLAMAMKNAIVPIRLAASLFHPIHIATIHNVTGMVRASKELLSGAIGPLEWGSKMGKEMTVVWSNIEDSRVGAKLMRAYKGKIDEADLTDADRQALQYLVEGGLTPELSMVYRGRALEKFHDAVTRRSATAVWHAPYAALEAVQGVMFQKWIPQLKIASYLKDVQTAAKVRPELFDNPDLRRVVLRQLAKSVDNRYGEMAYNTLFWNRWVKDLAVANTLSLGWQLGFVREFGGAALDTGRALTTRGGLASKAQSGLLDRSMFSLYYLTTTLGYGGLMTWAMTGKPPSSLTDYIYPQTGELDADGKPKRVSTPFYTREIASLYDHMVQEGALSAVGDIVKSKAAGQIGLISEWMRGVNDFGQEIRDPEAPLYKQIEQTLAHTLVDLEPISVTGGQGKPEKDKALSYLGFTSAPKYATRSPGEAEIEQTYQKYYAPKETPFDKAQYSQERGRLRELYSQNKDDEFDTQLDALQDKYQLDSGQVKRLVRGIAGGKSSYETMFQHFTVDQQRAALKKMSPDERQKYLPLSNREHREELEEEFGDESTG